MKKYWTKHSDAFKKNWRNETLWINPPQRLIPNIMEEIIEEEAQGIMIVPVCPQKIWFQSLSRIAVFWWDVALGESAITTMEGQALPSSQQRRLRVVFFKAFQARERADADAMEYCT